MSSAGKAPGFRVHLGKKAAVRFPDLVIVTWRDAWFQLGAPDDYNHEKEFAQRTVGWRLKAPPGHIRIAMSQNRDAFEDYMTLPLSMVKSISVVKKGDVTKA